MHTQQFATLLLLTTTWSGLAPAAPPRAIVWQGDGGRFVEADRKVSRSSITLTLDAHNFNHHRPEGRVLAVAALDQATAQLIEEHRRQPQFRNKRISESQRRDRTWGRVMTRTVELLVVDEEKLVAAERQRQQDADRDYERKKEAAERADRDYERKKEAAQDADRERQKRQEAAERAQRERQEQQEAADRAEREHQQRQAAAAAVPRVPPPAGARPLQVRVLPGGPNQSLQAVQAYATERHFVFDCQADPRQWPAYVGSLPLLVNVLNDRGEVVARYASPARYTARPTGPDENAELLKPAGNRLIFTVDEPVAKQAALVELGFPTPVKARP